jgi:hypothetical protein
MTRNFPILAAAATVAFLAFSFGEASAMNLGNRGGQPGGPSGPTESRSNSVQIYLPSGCDDRADLTELSGGARRDYLRRCGPQNRGF